MPKTLLDAFSDAKKGRQVLSKTVISESGVSKSQFYRILSGKESPSSETKKRISKSLGIETAQFDILHRQSGLDQTKVSTSKITKTFTPVLFASALAVLFVSLAFTLANNSKANDVMIMTENIAHADDSTLFIKDVTIPDGTVIPTNTTFVKTWRIKNTGKLVWKHRYLKRMTPTSDLICSSPAMVPIPETAPGETVDISVTFTTPHLPGSCRTDWKSADDRGNLFFPEMHGLFTIVVVSD